LARYRDALPQLGNGLFLTDGGLETTLIFHEGVDLPEFAAFVLLANGGGTDRLLRYYRRYMDIAAEAGAGFSAEAATWRASARWGSKLGYRREELAELNRKAIAILAGLRDGYESAVAAPFVISGCIGPRDDAYSPSTLMEQEEALDYHSEQIATLADTEADLVSALTITHTGEAIGVTRAAQHSGIPVVISFTVETDGRLPSGESLRAAVQMVDEATGSAPSYYMINCAHPSHFEPALDIDRDWVRRLRGIRANASRRSHAELDEADELDAGDPDELAGDYKRLLSACPHVTVLGGCCGTDHRHIMAIARTVRPGPFEHQHTGA
jgi:homocysteine S-methyltransferase